MPFMAVTIQQLYDSVCAAFEGEKKGKEPFSLFNTHKYTYLV